MIPAMQRGEQDANLDILRSIAVLAVFLTHSLQVMAGLRFGEHFAFGVETFSLGRVGVLIFFVHTSLVLMQSLERTHAHLAGWSLARHFYIRRAFRIYPLSLSLIAICIAFSIPPNAVGVSYVWHGFGWLVSNALLIQNIAGVNSVSDPLWSLPYELQMYLVLPALFIMLKGSRSAERPAAVYAIGALLSLIFLELRFVPCFLAGVIAYKRLEVSRPRLPAFLWIPFIFGAVSLYVTVPYFTLIWVKDVVLCLVIGLSIPMFRRSDGPVSAAAARIAKYSYGIYLAHTPVLWLLYSNLPLPLWLRMLCIVVATGAISVAGYHAIEHPLIQLGARVASRASATRRTVVATA
jgi:peptidoglycan/LPS O-acetylase OafA/YrhL